MPLCQELSKLLQDAFIYVYIYIYIHIYIYIRVCVYIRIHTTYMALCTLRPHHILTKTSVKYTSICVQIKHLLSNLTFFTAYVLEVPFVSVRPTGRSRTIVQLFYSFCIHEFLYVFVYVRMYVRMYVWFFVCMYVYVCICMYMYVYIYVYICIYTHTHKRINAYTFSKPSCTYTSYT